MRHRLHQIGTGCILPITLPLDAERIVLMIAHRDLQVRQVDLALEPSRGRNADMVETRSREYPHFFRLVPEVIGTVSGWERTAVPQAKSRNWSGDGGWPGSSSNWTATLHEQVIRNVSEPDEVPIDLESVSRTSSENVFLYSGFQGQIPTRHEPTAT